MSGKENLATHSPKCLRQRPGNSFWNLTEHVIPIILIPFRVVVLKYQKASVPGEMHMGFAKAGDLINPEGIGPFETAWLSQSSQRTETALGKCLGNH